MKFKELVSKMPTEDSCAPLPYPKIQKIGFSKWYTNNLPTIIRSYQFIKGCLHPRIIKYKNNDYDFAFIVDKDKDDMDKNIMFGLFLNQHVVFGKLTFKTWVRICWKYSSKNTFKKLPYEPKQNIKNKYCDQLIPNISKSLKIEFDDPLDWLTFYSEHIYEYYENLMKMLDSYFAFDTGFFSLFNFAVFEQLVTRYSYIQYKQPEELQSDHSGNE